MKKLMALILLLVCTAGIATAQRPQVGLLLGVQRSNLVGSGAEAFQFVPMSGGHVGFDARVPLAGNFAFARANILYTMRGAKSEDRNIRINLGYIEVPVMLQVESSRFYAEAGPQLSVRVKNIYTDKEGNSNVGELVDNVKTFSFGYAAGAGMHFGNIRVGLRYTRNLSSIINNSHNTQIRNTGIMLTTAILLPTI